MIPSCSRCFSRTISRSRLRAISRSGVFRPTVTASRPCRPRSAREQPGNDPLAGDRPGWPEDEFDHDASSEYLTADASRNRCSSLGRTRGDRSLTLTKATFPESTSRRNCRSEMPSASAAWSNVIRASRPVKHRDGRLVPVPMSVACGGRDHAARARPSTGAQSNGRAPSQIAVARPTVKAVVPGALGLRKARPVSDDLCALVRVRCKAHRLRDNVSSRTSPPGSSNSPALF